MYIARLKRLRQNLFHHTAVRGSLEARRILNAATETSATSSGESDNTVTDASPSESESDNADRLDGHGGTPNDVLTTFPHLQQLLGIEARSISSLSKEEAANIGSKLHSVCLLLYDEYADFISQVLHSI